MNSCNISCRYVICRNKVNEVHAVTFSGQLHSGAAGIFWGPMSIIRPGKLNAQKPYLPTCRARGIAAARTAHQRALECGGERGTRDSPADTAKCRLPLETIHVAEGGRQAAKLICNFFYRNNS